jgi:hypothetical protein
VTMSGPESVTASFAAQPAPSLTGFSPQAGTTGTQVVIEGASFTGATAVTFGGTAAQSFSVDSDTEIVAHVAAGTFTGRVVVTTSEGTATSSHDFTIYAPPTITRLSPTGGGVHATVTVTGTNLSGATSVRLNGTSVAFNVVSATTLTFTVPAAAATGTVSVTTPGGIATSAGTFTVASLPTITSFTPGSGPPGTPVTITGTNLGGTIGVTIGHVITVATAVSSTEVTFTVPPGAVSGVVAVLTTSGPATSAGAFTVTGA